MSRWMKTWRTTISTMTRRRFERLLAAPRSGGAAKNAVSEHLERMMHGHLPRTMEAAMARLAGYERALRLAMRELRRVRESRSRLVMALRERRKRHGR